MLMKFLQNKKKNLEKTQMTISNQEFSEENLQYRESYKWKSLNLV